jgi:hypothetical protein
VPAVAASDSCLVYRVNAYRSDFHVAAVQTLQVVGIKDAPLAACMDRRVRYRSGIEYRVPYRVESLER